MAMTKREKAIQAAVTPGKAYAIDEALKIVKDNSKAKFVEAVDVAVRLGVDAKKSDQQVRGSTVLPAGTGKAVRVAVFAPAGAKADEARAAGAEAVGMDDLAEQMQAGDLNYDVVIATPDAMRVVGKLGQLLGPRGVLPLRLTGQATLRPGRVRGGVQEVLEAKWNIQDLFKPFWAADRAQTAWKRPISNEAGKYTADITFGESSTVRTIIDALRSQQTYFLRIEMLGPLIEGSIHFLHQVDLAVKLITTSEWKNGNSVYARDVSLDIVEDPTWGHGALVTTVCDLATL